MYLYHLWGGGIGRSGHDIVLKSFLLLSRSSSNTYKKATLHYILYTKVCCCKPISSTAKLLKKWNLSGFPSQGQSRFDLRGPVSTLPRRDRRISTFSTFSPYPAAQCCSALGALRCAMLLLVYLYLPGSSQHHCTLCLFPLTTYKTAISKTQAQQHSPIPNSSSNSLFPSSC
ncbi:hypothetical protein BU24DRAFT_174615 [Aaosphaeria arxii CBS 175.79]|uniref:Uncharacterized protein n=1 Tax=Aaosphaeria arxii CBS 175.79 TaxID=1450172 RepID=A0A6A5XPR9_9PLEO|nr:uncharacterized protein BU24DRAFT_174615 [Aaosphaeria arxii CBS 175.79]KAF2015265.1 hypothetical protein BU24DRAFT_174615 [Aaosphaeria arxii CBS 175.79]